MRRFLIGVFAALLVAGADSARALDPDLSINQYFHTSWTAAEGAPATVLALAQGSDGYLWIGGAQGLFRFDGVVFERMPDLGQGDEGRRVSALLAAADGALWIGYDTGEFAVRRNGVVTDTSTAANDRYVIHLTQTPDGAVWALTGRPDNPLLRNVNGRWEEIGEDWGLPRDWPVATAIGASGELWLTTLHAVFVLRAGGRRFERIQDTNGNAAIARAPDGSIWIADRSGARQVGRGGPVFPTPGAIRGTKAIFDRDGNLWGVNQHGLYRLAAAGWRDPDRSPTARVELFTAADGLTSNILAPILEDREGNIWVGSTLGLDRFRPANVVVERHVSAPPQFGYDLYAAADGIVYAGAGNAIYRALPGERLERFIETGSQSDAVCEGPDGSVWFFLRDRLIRIRGSQVTRMALPQAVGTGFHYCAVDRNGVLWVTAQRDGVFSLGPAGWRPQPLEDGDWRVAMMADRGRRVVQYLNSGGFARADDEGRLGALLFSSERASTLFDGAHGLWIGGPFGLALLGENTRVIERARAPWAEDATGIVETPRGETWIIGAAGIAGVDSEALYRAAGDADAPLNPIVLSFADGLPNIYNRIGGRDAVVGGDGRVWFATLGNIVGVDPARLARNTVPPPVAVRALVAGDAQFQDPASVDLGAGNSNVVIQYTALSLSIPERVRFRYRLEGVDREWVDAGPRREVQYSNLDPGRYRFRVIAANNDGVWNDAGAMVEFTIAPTFVQSIWFKLIVALAVFTLGWAAYAYRLRLETARLRSRHDIQTAERERIARELHDTLLQSFQALVLRFQLVADKVETTPVRAELNEALDRAEGALVEGRERVRDLRHAAGGDLQEAIAAVAARVIENGSPRLVLVVEGSPRPLRPTVSEEIVRIAEQALVNAKQHAQARTIEALLSYGQRALRLVIRDDGVGISEVFAQGREREGHFGLVGMRERAVRIEAVLTISSRPGAGTEVTLVTPARSVYLDDQRSLLDRALAIVRGRQSCGERGCSAQGSKRRPTV